MPLDPEDKQNPAPVLPQTQVSQNESPSPPAKSADSPPISTPNSSQKPPGQISLSQKPQNPNVVYPKSTKKLFFTTFAIILLLVLLTTGAAIALAYNNYALIKPPKLISNAIDTLIAASVLPKPPRIVLGSVVAKAATLKSANIKTEMFLSTTDNNSPITSLKLVVVGPVNFEKTTSQAAEADVSMEVKFEGASFNGTASVKTIENTLFFKVTEFPFGSLYQQLLSYKNKWFYYKIPEEYAQKDQELLISDDVKKLLAEFVEKSQTWTKTTTDANGDYLLEATPPKSDLDKLILDILSSYAQRDDQKEKLLQSVKLENVSKFTEKLANLKITATASKDNYYPKNISVSFDITPENITLPSGSESLLPASLSSYNFKLSSEFSNYNKQIVVVPPEGAEDIAQVVDSLSKNPYNSLNTSTALPDGQIKYDVATLAREAQAFAASAGGPNYPPTLENLKEANKLEALPIPPAETGLLSYRYLVEPPNCQGTELSRCINVAIYAPLTQPKTAGNVWCWQSAKLQSQELAKNDCTPKATAANQTGNGISLKELLSPKSPVLGTRSSWDLELLKMFTSFIK